MWVSKYKQLSSVATLGDLLHRLLSFVTQFKYISLLPFAAAVAAERSSIYNETDRYKTNYTNLVKRIALAFKRLGHQLSHALSHVCDQGFQRSSLVVDGRQTCDTFSNSDFLSLFAFLVHSRLIDLFYI